MKKTEDPPLNVPAEWHVLPFRINGQWYAVSLEDMERLCGLEELNRIGVPTVVLPGQGEGALAVLLRGTKGLFALLIDEAETVCPVPSEMRLPLPDALREPENNWIEGAFYWTDGAALCFLLRCAQLEP